MKTKIQFNDNDFADTSDETTNMNDFNDEETTNKAQKCNKNRKPYYCIYDDEDNDIKIEDIDKDNNSQAVVLEQNGDVKKTTMATDDDDDKASFDS